MSVDSHKGSRSGDFAGVVDFCARADGVQTTPDTPARRVVILGSTGSIGTQALELIADNPGRFDVVGIAVGGGQPDLLIAQIKQLGVDPACVAVADEAVAWRIGAGFSGPRAAEELVAVTSPDLVLNALVGSLGLGATLAALDCGAQLALANKESLIAGGNLVISRASHGQIVPVDSEHSAMAQCLAASMGRRLDHLVLTASGGPFRGWSAAELESITVEQALKHPTWSMGQMNTLNSATLVNKGLEFIEACYLFGLRPEQIEVVVNPQSIVHSMATFEDGCTMAQASDPSMKLPIALGLNWPASLPGAQAGLDFSRPQQWTFEPVDDAVFPAVDLARAAARAGGMVPAVYNASNEEAVAAFVDGRISFPRISATIEQVMGRLGFYTESPTCVEDVLAVEADARRVAHEFIAGFVA